MKTAVFVAKSYVLAACLFLAPMLTACSVNSQGSIASAAAGTIVFSPPANSEPFTATIADGLHTETVLLTFLASGQMGSVYKYQSAFSPETKVLKLSYKRAVAMFDSEKIAFQDAARLARSDIAAKRFGASFVPK